MKYKTIEKTEAPKTKRKGRVNILQKLDDITILNHYNNGKLCFRHCIILRTGEHATWYMDESKWTENTLLTAYGFREWWEKEQYRLKRYYNDSKQKHDEAFKLATNKDAEEIRLTITKLHNEKYWTSQNHASWIDLIDRLEKEYDDSKRENAKQRRYRRIQELMDSIIGQPQGFEKWAIEKTMGPTDIAVYNAKTKKWCCSACGEQHDRALFVDDQGQQVKTRENALCPNCRSQVTMLPRHKDRDRGIEIEYNAPVAFFQDLNKDMSVIRHFRFFVTCTDDSQKFAEWHETVRIVMYRGDSKKRYQIYYNINSAGVGRSKHNYLSTYYGYSRGCESWQTTNPASQRMTAEYLYSDPTEISAALTGTIYEHWIRSFQIMASKDLKLNYNKLMACSDKRFSDISELLCKGRFYKLLAENTDYVWPSAGSYYGHLNLKGSNIRSVMGLDDMQLVNRLRDMDGGVLALKWLKWAEKNGRKIPQKALEWLSENEISTTNYYTGNEILILKYMSPEQIMHYIQRQQATGYKGHSISRIINQWSDYMDMAKKLGKKTKDELIYKPADLKARHDEYVELCAKKAKIIEAKNNREYAKRMAKEMREKFPTSEGILKEIKPLLEWENEQFKIIVPKSLADIIFEGSTLHHCAGSTDRYFDRICQHETYICFLRKTKKPKEPFYTIEVEPGGVIRQHRGAYDEEPEIETVKPALMEWQKEIKKRMKKKDKDRAKEAERKRIENVAYLKEHITEKNNRRVLEGLEEDLMVL